MNFTRLLIRVGSSNLNKVICRTKGGLGNQLFCYTALPGVWLRVVGRNSDTPRIAPYDKALPVLKSDSPISPHVKDKTYRLLMVKLHIRRNTWQGVAIAPYGPFFQRSTS